jgi:hypothetical protein
LRGVVIQLRGVVIQLRGVVIQLRGVVIQLCGVAVRSSGGGCMVLVRWAVRGWGSHKLLVASW